MGVIAVGALIKIVFEWGESAPIWGRYGGLKISLSAIFGPKFLKIHSPESHHFLGIERTFCVHQICEKQQKSIRQKLVVFEVKVPEKSK